MFFRMIASILFLGFSAAPVLAHGGHGHKPASESTAISKAKEVVGIMIKKGKLDKSWEKNKKASAEKHKTEEGVEWKVTFENAEVKDKSKSTLFVFLSISGDYRAANFTGS